MRGPEDRALTPGWKGISGSTLKLVAIAAMLMDHIALALVLRMLRTMPPGGQADFLRSLYTAMRTVGRLAFPIFCFLLVEGFERTGSRGRYLARLGAFALLSEAPYDLAFCGAALEFRHQNVYFTLFLGLLALWGYVWIRRRPMPSPAGWAACAVGIGACGAWLTGASRHFVRNRLLPLVPGPARFGPAAADAALFAVICLGVGLLLLCRRWRMGRDKALAAGTCLAVLFPLMLLADLLHTDYAGTGVLTISVMYLLRRDHVRATAAGCGVLLLKGLNELSAFGSLIPIAVYNGKRGLSLKYVFYLFYPVHLLLLWLAAWRMGTAFMGVI